MRLCAVLFLLFGLSVGHLRSAPPMKWDSLMLLKAAAERGDPEAQFLIGLQYRVGDGLEKNSAEAVKWLRKAAEAGQVEAQFALGELYADSDSAEGLADPEEAVKWLQAAAEHGNIEAQSRLGALRAKGLTKHRYRTAESRGHLPAGATEGATGGVATPAGSAPLVAVVSRVMAEDPAETIRWSLLLSGLRGAEAYLVRGFLLENGVVVNRDLGAAADSYRKAAGLGDARAQYRLGRMYAAGRGVERDIAESRAWLSRAAAQGSAEAAEALAGLKDIPPPEQKEGIPAPAPARPPGRK